MSLSETRLTPTLAANSVAPGQIQDTSSPAPTATVGAAAHDHGAVEAGAPGLPLFQFSQAEYRGKTSALITVTLAGTNANEARATFTAKEGSATAEREVARKELVFENGKTSSSFSIEIGPNISDAQTIIELKLSDTLNANLGEPHEAILVVEPTGGPLEYFRNLIGSILSDPSNGRVARHIILGFILIGTVTTVHKIVAAYADSHQTKWQAYLSPTAKMSLAFPVSLPPERPPLLEHEQSRLKDQLERIRLKQSFHLNLMAYFYKGYYLGIVILSFTGALAAIALVLISKKGWAATSEYVITTFFIMTCAALFYGSWAGLFKQEDNITSNKVLFLKYTALENELFSYVATGEALRYDVSANEVKTAAPATKTPATDKPAQEKKTATKVKSEAAPDPDKGIGIPLPAPAFIHYVDLQLAQDNIAIGFDYSQIPNYKAAFSNLGDPK